MTLVKIKRRKSGIVSAFLVYNNEAVILVDTGHAGTTQNFIDAIGEMQKKPEDVNLIVLTHTHFDHAGGAKKIKALTGAPLAVHRSEAGFLQEGRTPFPAGTRWKGKLLIALSKVFARRLASYPAVEPDVLVEEALSLHDYGIPGKILHTPGHTCGSLSVLLESGEAIVGDNVLGISPKTHYPPFADDRAGVLKCWETYISSGVKTLLPAHGGRVQIEALVRELPAARRRYG
jgi:glyoxylase-like metal-dependent hydrolase (beta-lactamase superfamily II)